jgi:hypothetical protein
MAISLASLKRSSDRKPPRMLVYGTHGIGKTTLGVNAPAPVFLQTEESEVSCPTFGLLKTYDEVMEALAALYNEPHDFQTVVVDSLDWLEPLVWRETCRLNKWANIEDAGYGKGYLAALDQWRSLLDGFNALRDEKQMGVMLLAHCEIKRFDSPETEPYDRYQIKLQPRASALVQEHVDCVLFANYRVSTVKTDLGFNKKAVRGVGGGDRMLYTTERPAFLAKNRYGLPDSVPLDWSALAAAIPYYTPNQAAPAAAAE